MNTHAATSHQTYPLVWGVFFSYERGKIMERFSWLDIGHYKCLMQDFSGADVHEIKNLLETSHRELKIHSRNHKVVVITNIEDVKFDKDVTHLLCEIAVKNKPYIQDSAIYGVDVYQKVALSSISKISSRDFKLFKDKKAALEWLDQFVD